MNQHLMNVPVSAGTDVAKAEFIRKTYLHLAIAVLGFILVEYLFLNTPAIVAAGLAMTQGYRWLIMLGGFMFATTIADSWAAKSHNRNLQYAGLALYVVAQAFIFVPLLYIATTVMNDPSLVGNAAILTLGLFTGLTMIVFMTGKDFSFLRSFLMIGGFIAIALIAAGILFGFTLGLFFSVAMVALAAGSILYQTSNLVHQYSNDQYVAAALGLFASLMLMFWYILQILMSFSGDD